jgi:hypothetical protein
MKHSPRPRVKQAAMRRMNDYHLDTLDQMLSVVRFCDPRDPRVRALQARLDEARTLKTEQAIDLLADELIEPIGHLYLEALRTLRQMEED